MINLKKIIYFLIIFTFFSAETSAEIKDSLFATIGNKAITRSDILTEIKTILILNGQTFSEDQKDAIQAAAIQSTIKRSIKKIEIEKYDSLEFSSFDLNNQLIKYASNLNTDLETLKSIFEANEINFDIIVDQVKTELLWNSLIFSLYNKRLTINQIEIDEQLKLFQNTQEVVEYLVSEIIIAKVSTAELKAKITEIKNQIKTQGFETVAMNLSISETAIKGGNLGWISENLITKEFKEKIIETPIGEISKPVFLPQGILFFQVKDKRKIKKFENLEEAKNDLVQAEKKKILNMHSLSHYDNLKRSTTINYY